MVATLLDAFEPLIAAALKRGDIENYQAEALRLRLDVTGRNDDVVHNWVSPATEDPEFEHFTTETGEFAFMPTKGMQVKIESNQSIPNDTETSLLWNVSATNYLADSGFRIDPDNTNRLLMPAPDTDRIYLLAGNVDFDQNSTGYRLVVSAFFDSDDVQLEGHTLAQRDAQANVVNDTLPFARALRVPSAANYFEVRVLQNSGGALNVGFASFSIMRAH